MPRSQQPTEGEELVYKMLLNHRHIVDVGAGDGKWGRRLIGHVQLVDGIEVWAPYVLKYNLVQIYDRVFMVDARKFREWGEYDAVIFGDVLEHMRRGDAIEVVSRAASRAAVYLTIPISPCPQDGLVYGNPYETHLDQWTHEEVLRLGFEVLHRGFNKAGTVEIGTYRRV